MDSGSGVVGPALLTTVRDATGAGPSVPWFAAIFADGLPLLTGTMSYDAPGPGSYVAWAWPHPEVESASSLELATGPSFGTAAYVPFAAAPPSTVGIPAPRLSADGQRIEWPAVPGAVTYRCTVVSATLGVTASIERVGPERACDMSALPAGSYLGAVEALSFDLAALAASTSAVPDLPDRFDVSVGYIGVVRRAGSEPPLQMLVAGGVVTMGGYSFLATWISITDPSGTPAPNSWSLSYMERGTDYYTYWATYPAATARSLEVRNSDYLATRGRFIMRASAGPSLLYVDFIVGAPAELVAPTDVVATGAALGAATVDWTPVAGARSYLVRAWDTWGYRWASECPTEGPPLTFPAGTFLPGTSYEVYVVATDADLIGGTVPTQVGAAENAVPAIFTAP